MSVNADRIVTAAMTELRADGFKVDEAATQAPVGTTGKSGLELNLKAIADAVVDEFTEHWTGGGSWGNLPDGDGVPQRVGDVWSMVQDFLTKTAADALYATTSALSTVASSAASALATATTAAAAAAAAMAAIPAAASTDPLMDGLVSVGAASAYARADHRHPTDVSREPAITAGAAGQWWRYDKTWVSLSASDVGGLGSLATLSQIADAQVASGAAIAWSKVSKAGAAAADVGALGATAAAGGDLAGNYPSPTVSGLRGYVLPTLSSTAGGLRWSGTAWTLDSTAYLSMTAAAATYQSKITTGTTAQYLRGDLSLATFPTAVSAFTNDSGYITSAGSISGNAATATKLATARTIAATGDAAWSVSFDGLANVSSVLTVSGLRGYVLPTLNSTAGSLRWSGTAWALDSTAYLSMTAAASVYLPLAGGTMNAGAKILTLQDMTIITGANGNYSNAPFVAQRYTSDSTTTTHASIGFHNRGVNAAALYFSSQYFNFWYNDHLGGVYHLWDSKDLSSTNISNWNTAYGWGNHASAGYLLPSSLVWVGGNNYSWTGFTGCNSTTWSGYMQSSIETLIGALSGGSISLAVAQTRVLTISGSLVSTTLPLTVAGVITASGGITGTLTGHASLDIPLAGGTMADNSGIRVDGSQSGGFVTQYKNTFYPTDLRLAGISSGYFNFGYSSSLFSSLSFIGTTYSSGYVKLDGPGTSGNLMANKFILAGGSAAQFLKADGSVDNNVYLPSSGTASNTLALGGVAADYFVQGTGNNSSSTFGKRTTSFNYNGATASSTCLTDPLYSGFYDGYFAAGQTPNNGWVFVINAAHSNMASNSKFQFQIASSFDNGKGNAFWGGENYWMRVINNSGVGDWRTLIHSANYPSFNNFTSGLSTTTLTASSDIVSSRLLPSAYRSFDIGSYSYQYNNIWCAKIICDTTSITTLSAIDLRLSSTATISGMLNANGGISLSTVALSASVSFDANAHLGKIVNLGTSYIFDLSTMTSGNWCIVSGLGYVTCGGSVTYYLRGASVTGTHRIMGSSIVYRGDSSWYVG